LAKTDQTAEPN